MAKTFVHFSESKKVAETAVRKHLFAQYGEKSLDFALEDAYILVEKGKPGKPTYLRMEWVYETVDGAKASVVVTVEKIDGKWKQTKIFSKETETMSTINNASELSRLVNASDEALKTLIEERRTGRIKRQFSIRKGETHYGRYTYGAEVVAPDGQRFSLVSSGSPESPVWRWYSIQVLWYRFENGGYDLAHSPDKAIVPSIWKSGNLLNGKRSEAIEVDLVNMQDTETHWCWEVYLPSDEWQISVWSYSHTRRM